MEAVEAGLFGPVAAQANRAAAHQAQPKLRPNPMSRTPTTPPELLPSQRAERAVRAEAALREALLRIDELQLDLARCRAAGMNAKRMLDRLQAGHNARSHT